MSAYEKLNIDSSGMEMSPVAVDMIKNHLLKHVQDETFEVHVLKESKSLKDCISYIVSEARKRLDGKSGGLADTEVYAIADEYFISDEIAEPAAAKPARNVQQIEPRVEPKKEADDNQLSVFDML